MRDKIKTCKKNKHMYLTEWHSLTFCIYAYTGHTIVHSGQKFYMNGMCENVVERKECNDTNLQFFTKSKKEQIKII